MRGFHRRRSDSFALLPIQSSGDYRRAFAGGLRAFFAQHPRHAQARPLAEARRNQRYPDCNLRAYGVLSRDPDGDWHFPRVLHLRRVSQPFQRNPSLHRSLKSS